MRKYIPYNIEINSLCFDFYFEYKQDCIIHLIDYDLWGTLTQMNVKTFLCNQFSDDTIRGFTAYDSVRHIKQYKLITDTNNIIKRSILLVNCNYIRLVATISDSALNVQIPHSSANKNILCNRISSSIIKNETTWTR